MSKNLSDNRPVKTGDKKYIKNFPLDDRHIWNIFEKCRLHFAYKLH